MTTASLLALVSTLALAALHLLAPRLRTLRILPEHAVVSLSGGMAVSYVFLHLLPELAEGQVALREAMGEEGTPAPLTELGIFVVALGGFAAFYALERLAERTAAHRHGLTSRWPFRVHLGAFAFYNAVITYTLQSTYRTGVGFALLFTVAMGLHFVISDRGLQEHYGRLFGRWPPRILLAVALLAGWTLSVLFAPTRAVVVSLLIAFLAGSVLLNVFKEEIPSARRSSMPWFLAGLVTYAALLAVVTRLGSER